MSPIGRVEILSGYHEIKYSPSFGAPNTGETRSPECHTVYEIVQNEGCVWLCVGDERWLANDSSAMKIDLI